MCGKMAARLCAAALCSPVWCFFYACLFLSVSLSLADYVYRRNNLINIGLKCILSVTEFHDSHNILRGHWAHRGLLSASASGGDREERGSRSGAVGLAYLQGCGDIHTDRHIQASCSPMPGLLSTRGMIWSCYWLLKDRLKIVV